MTPGPAATDLARNQQRRGFWLRTLHQWHWISSALCLIGMLLFAITGLTLNHAALIEATPHTINRTLSLPAELRTALPRASDQPQALPIALADWLQNELGVRIGSQQADISDDEIYLNLPGPGRDAWLSIQRSDGAVEYENIDRGWIAYFNDLHKGRDSGPAWGWFIDVFALACIVFTLTGLLLLQLHARQRAMTWPMVGLGLLVPLLLLLLFVH